MIDASHGNSGKDPDRQVAAADEIAGQVSAGTRAIVGVMLESFIVAGRQDLDLAARSPTASRSPTPALTGSERR